MMFSELVIFTMGCYSYGSLLLAITLPCKHTEINLPHAGRKINFFFVVATWLLNILKW